MTTPVLTRVSRGLATGLLAGASLLTVGALTDRPAIAEDTVKLGAPIPLTGPFASDGAAMDKGIRLAIEDLNSAGGLLGRQIEYQAFDIGDLTPDKLQAAAANLVERNEVDVLINGYGGMGPDIPAFCPYSLPYINNNATSNVVELRDRMGCSNIFMGSDVDTSYGEIAFAQLTSLGQEFSSQRIAVITGPFDWEFNNVDGAVSTAESAGWEMVLREEVPYGTTEWSGILSKLRDAEPALIYMELLEPAAVKSFVDQFRGNPVPGATLFVGYTLSVPAFTEIAASGAVEGVFGMSLSAHRPDEAGQGFAEKWRAAYNEEPPFSIAAQIYDEVMLWAAAVTEAGDPRDFDAVQAAIVSLNYEGITGTFTFNEQQFIDAGDDTLPSHLLQVQGNQVVQVMIGTEQVADPITPSWAD